MLTQRQIDLIQENFAAMKGIAPQTAEMFYQRLFELDPSVRQLFTGDMENQGRKLMTLIGTAVSKLHRLDEIIPSIQDLGRRHVDYSVQSAHYDTAGKALLWTLAQGLDDQFTPAHREAWAICYGLLADTMKNAAGELQAT